MDETRQITGSRNQNGNVPNVNWNDDKMNVNWYNPQNTNDNLRSREVVSIPKRSVIAPFVLNTLSSRWSFEIFLADQTLTVDIFYFR